MRIEAGKTTYFEGFNATFKPDPTPVKPIPGDTAIHEAMHVVAAIKNGTSIESASIIPGPGYLGITKLSKPDAVAAMAPHSMGASGTSFDVFIASHIGNSSGAESAARGIISSNMDEVEVVAATLEEKKSVGSHDITKALFELDHPLPEFGTIYIEGKDGRTQEKKVEVRDNIVIEDLAEVFKETIHIN